MAVRVQNSATVNFGVFAAATTVTHARLRVGNNTLATRALTNSRAIEAGGQAQFAVGDIDLVFPANQLENAGLNAILAEYFDGTNTLLIDLMTSNTQVVTVSGYSQQSTAGWGRSSESD